MYKSPEIESKPEPLSVCCIFSRLYEVITTFDSIVAGAFCLLLLLLPFALCLSWLLLMVL